MIAKPNSLLRLIAIVFNFVHVHMYVVVCT